MSRGRRVPPCVLLDPPPPDTDGYRRATAADEAFFLANPSITYYTRAYVPGETPVPMPPGTIVAVERVGYRRYRGFITPNLEGN